MISGYKIKDAVYACLLFFILIGQSVRYLVYRDISDLSFKQILWLYERDMYIGQPISLKWFFKWNKTIYVNEATYK
jgi:hypothetical protein